MKSLMVEPVLTDEQAAELAGEFVGQSHYHTLIDSDADIFRPDGSALLHFRRNRVAAGHANDAFKALYEAATEYGNRGIAAGKLKYHTDRSTGYPRTVASQDDVRFQYIKRDGTMSKTNKAMTVPSGIIGAFDRVPRFPYCRLSKYTTDYPERIAASLPFIRDVDAVFRSESPDRYAAQMAQVERTHPDYVFPGTAFTTITVNRNWRTACHQDAGDLRSGFGVLSVLSEGRYSGGYFVIPKYGIAVDMQHRDVPLVDVHEWHGNTELVGVSKYWTRLSTVFYFRSKIVGCRSLAEELEIAKNRTEGMPMYADFKGEFPE